MPTPSLAAWFAAESGHPEKEEVEDTEPQLDPETHSEDGKVPHFSESVPSVSCPHFSSPPSCHLQCLGKAADDASNSLVLLLAAL